MSTTPSGPKRSRISLRATLRRCGRAANSVFGRLALLAVTLLILIQATWTIVIVKHQGDVETDHVGRLVRLAADASRATGDGLAPSLRTQLTHTLGIRFIDAAGARRPLDCPNTCIATTGAFEKHLLRHLSPGSAVILDKRLGEVWVRPDDGPTWIVIPTQLPSAWRLAGANGATLIIALCIALLGAWQVERPLLRLARAARQLRVGLRPPPIVVEGPSELKALTRDFNEMARAIIDAEQERAVMLAGVAHDLRAPLTRIQVRASIVEHRDLQAGFLQDSASLSQIVTQFLDLAREADDDSDAEWVEVDPFCATHYAPENDEHGNVACHEQDKEPGNDSGDQHVANGTTATVGSTATIDVMDVGDKTIGDMQREPLIQLRLAAGAGFTLPGIELDRILSNLIENAFAYGAPPLLIATEKRHDHFLLSVTDSGAGMPETDFDRALRPFVRLDAARGGDAHCGLGLTIVRRLTRRYGGELALSNAPGAGLCVTLTFPVAARRAGTRRRAGV